MIKIILSASLFFEIAYKVLIYILIMHICYAEVIDETFFL